MSNTIIESGSFTSKGAITSVALRSDLDWMWTYNYTKIAANARSTGYQFYWQRGMADAAGIEYKTAAADASINMSVITTAGFTLLDTSDKELPARVALTAITNANPPAVTSAASLPALGSIVRFSSLTGQTQLGGIDFTVTASGGGAFSIGNISMLNTTATTPGYWRTIPFDSSFYPRRRAITFVSSSATAGRAKIYMSVTHTITVGEKVRLSFPGGSDVWGNYAQLDGRLCTVLATAEARAGAEPTNALGDNNIVVDIDVSGLGNWNVFGGATAAAYPLSTRVPFTHAQVIPVGEDLGIANASGLSGLADATIDKDYIGMQLGAGADGPAGAENDVIYWTAGKSFRVR